MNVVPKFRSIAGSLAMAGLGASAALLLAPQSGRRTRWQIRVSAERCRYSAADAMEHLREKLTHVTAY